MAQSSVTLYGILDLWAGSVKTESAAAGSLSQTVMQSGGVNGSRWGMKGSEDLGGGLKANFDLQSGFNLDDGTQAQGRLFGRQSWVGFSGNFGAVRLGRTTTPFDDVSGTSDAVFDSALAPMNSVFKSANSYTIRTNNTIFYQAPTMGGLSGAISYALGEDKTATTSASSTTSMNLTYAAGPVAVQFGYQVEDTAAAADVKYTRLGGSYDLGVAKLKAIYGKTQNVVVASVATAGYDATDYQIGVDFPVSAALTLSASYAKSNDSKSTGFESSRKGYGIAGAYTLSKRTFLYGGLESDTATVASAADSKKTVFAVGVQHRF